MTRIEAKIINDVQGIRNRSLKATLLADRAALLRFLQARRMTRDEAEDLLQDLFLKLENHDLGAVEDPRAYLYRMADNLLLDRRRSDGRRIVREAAWVADQRHGSGERSDAPSAVQQLIDRERLAAVSSALAELPERTLSIFRRFRVEGIPQKQIAEELEISVSAVEKHLQRAYHVVTEARARLDADIAGSRRPLGREE